VTAVVDLFAGQEKRQDTFTITNEQQMSIEGGTGVRNVLTITDEQFVRNMNAVQKRHNLPATDDLQGCNFCVEMETGTGKTYVYTKTIFELHRQYGFTKFIVVAPSVAIREGVYKSFQITAGHFAAERYDSLGYERDFLCVCFSVFLKRAIHIDTDSDYFQYSERVQRSGAS
jgi:type III restriction enzyme